MLLADYFYIHENKYNPTNYPSFFYIGKRKICFGSTHIAHINNIFKEILSKEMLKVMIYVRKSMAVYMLFPLN